MGAGSVGAGWDCSARRGDADVVVVVFFASVRIPGVNKESESLLCLHFYRPPASCFTHVTTHF